MHRVCVLVCMRQQHQLLPRLMQGIDARAFTSLGTREANGGTFNKSPAAVVSTERERQRRERDAGAREYVRKKRGKEERKSEKSDAWRDSHTHTGTLRACDALDHSHDGGKWM